jgi:hypothetical protein
MRHRIPEPASGSSVDIPNPDSEADHGEAVSVENPIGNHMPHPETLMLNYGYDPQLSEGAVKPPVFLTSTFVFRTDKSVP